MLAEQPLEVVLAAILELEARSVSVYCLSAEETRISPAFACAAIRDVRTTLRPSRLSSPVITKPECTPMRSSGPEESGWPSLPNVRWRSTAACRPPWALLKRGEESVALESDDLPVVMLEHTLDEQVMVAQELLPALRAEPGDDGLGVGDVAQHQRHRSVGRAELAHREARRLERRGDHIDRCQVCRTFHSETLRPPQSGGIA